MTTITRSLAYDTPVADILTAAADRIAINGLNTGHYWPDAMWWEYREGAPTDMVGAIAVTVGVTVLVEVEDRIVPPPDAYTDPAAAVAACHPAIRALITHLALPDVEALFAWSDTVDVPTAVTTLQVTAAALRTSGVPA